MSWAGGTTQRTLRSIRVAYICVLSAFVGLAVMVALFPLPGYVAKRLQDVHVTRMEMTDARIETVSESQFFQTSD